MFHDMLLLRDGKSWNIHCDKSRAIRIMILRISDLSFAISGSTVDDLRMSSLADFMLRSARVSQIFSFSSTNLLLGFDLSCSSQQSYRIFDVW